MPPSMLTDASLSTIVEGVESSAMLFGRRVRVVVTAEALGSAFGVGEEPSEWLAAFAANATRIEQAVRQSFIGDACNLVVLTHL